MYDDGLRLAIVDLKWEIAAQRCLRTARRLIALLAKANFNPAQPRVPTGNPDGGQWTDTGANAGGARIVRVGARGRGSVSVRAGRTTLEATPSQAARLAVADGWARESARRVREINPSWRPRPSLVDPNRVEGAIRRAEREVREAEARLRELAHAQFGDNQGTLLPPPFEAIRSYRSITGMPDIGDRLASRMTDGTVAFTNIDDTPEFGVNSNSPAYSANDQAAAEAMRGTLIDRYPDIMSTDNLGRHPNNSLFHAEANALLRAAEASGGSLHVRVINIRIDRRLCDSCDEVLPLMGLRLGNPTVTFIDGTGAVWIMRHGIWLKRGRP